MKTHVCEKPSILDPALKLRWLTRAKVQRSYPRTSGIRTHCHQKTEGYSGMQRLGGWHLDHVHGPEAPMCLSHPVIPNFIMWSSWKREGVSENGVQKWHSISWQTMPFCGTHFQTGPYDSSRLCWAPGVCAGRSSSKWGKLWSHNFQLNIYRPERRCLT